jgi:hypothetical protein
MPLTSQLVSPVSRMSDILQQLDMALVVKSSMISTFQPPPTLSFTPPSISVSRRSRTAFFIASPVGQQA